MQKQDNQCGKSGPSNSPKRDRRRSRAGAADRTLAPINALSRPGENIMIRDRETETRDLTIEQLDLVAGGAMMDDLKLTFEIPSAFAKTRSKISMTFAYKARA